MNLGAWSILWRYSVSSRILLRGLGAGWRFHETDTSERMSSEEEKTVRAKSYGPPSLPYTHKRLTRNGQKVGEIPREEHFPGTKRAGSFKQKSMATVSIPETGQVQ